jgi:hypothetical protein
MNLLFHHVGLVVMVMVMVMIVMMMMVMVVGLGRGCEQAEGRSDQRRGTNLFQHA